MPDAGSRLAEHHRRCEALFAAAGVAADASDWTQLNARVGALREALLEHFHYEEERIFPLYEEGSGEEGATEPLRAAHDDMRASLWALATMSSSAELERYREELAQLRAAFAAHAADEESRMYPVFERLLEARASRG